MTTECSIEVTLRNESGIRLCRVINVDKSGNVTIFYRIWVGGLAPREFDSEEEAIRQFKERLNSVTNMPKGPASDMSP